MTTYEFGDIVLVEFPQTGTESTKRRPTLVILDIDDRDVVLAPITTRERVAGGDAKIVNWSSAGLLRESWVRLAKVAALEKIQITRKLGWLVERDREEAATIWNALYAL